jgi:hypothetical protein
VCRRTEARRGGQEDADAAGIAPTGPRPTGGDLICEVPFELVENDEIGLAVAVEVPDGDGEGLAVRGVLDGGGERDAAVG